MRMRTKIGTETRTTMEMRTRTIMIVAGASVISLILSRQLRLKETVWFARSGRVDGESWMALTYVIPLFPGSVH